MQVAVVREILNGSGSEAVHLGRLVSLARLSPSVLGGKKCGLGGARDKRIDRFLQFHRGGQRIAITGEGDVSVRHNHVCRSDGCGSWLPGFLVVVIVAGSTPGGQQKSNES